MSSRNDTLLAALALTLNGYRMDATSPLGPVEVRGLDGLPDMRTSDSERPASDGDIVGTDLLGSRVIEVDLSGSPSNPADELAKLRAATVRGDSVLVVEGMLGLPTVRMLVRVRKAEIPTDTDLAFGVSRPRLQMYCPDPLRYAAAETVLTLDLREQITGHSVYATPRPYASPIRYDGVTGAPTVYLTPPVTPPVTPGGRPGMVATLTALNAGLYPTAPIIRVFGPSPAFSLLQGTTNRRWSYTQPVAASDFLEIDMRARTVLLNGTASRRQFKRGAWWDLPPGSSSVAFLPNEPAVGAQVEVRFRSAY